MQTFSGTHLGRYEVLEVLGRGAMGIVYKAHDPQIDRNVAIKMIAVLAQELDNVLFPDLDAEDALASKHRFLLEAKAAGRLLHPGIVQVFDIGEEPETRTPYIVMEYVSGKPLHAFVSANGGKLSSEVALRICQQVAEALGYAHSQGVIHRDIKPSNILITDDAQAKIADFGVAKLDLSYCTLPGQLIGTPAYMAPEQLTSSEVDGRADLFSVGVILYSLLSGHRPFQGDGASTISYKVVNRDPVPVSALELHLPKDVDYVISRAIAKNPDERYQTGTEMALDIQDLLDGKAPRTQLSRTPVQVPPDRPSGVNSAVVKTSTRSTNGEPSSKAVPPSQVSTTPPATTTSAKPKTTFRYLTVAGAVAALVLTGVYVSHSLARTASANVEQNGESNQTVSADLADAINQGAATVSSGVVPKSTPDDSNSGAGPQVDVSKNDTKSARRQPAAGSVKASGKSEKAPRGTGVGMLKAAASATPSEAHLVSQPTQAAPAKLDTVPLRITVDHGFEAAAFSVWIDDKLAYQGPLRGESKKSMFLFRRTEGSNSSTIQVPSGQHRLRVRIQSGSGEDGYDESRLISGAFSKDQPRVLNVHCDKRKNDLQLRFEP